MNRSKFFRCLIWPFSLLLIFGILVLIERLGLQYADSSEKYEPVPDGEFVSRDEKRELLQKECLYITDSNDPYTAEFDRGMMFVLDEMSVGYDVVDIAVETAPDPTPYKTAVFSAANLVLMKDELFDYIDWVNDGGGLMFARAFEYDAQMVYEAIKSKVGIISSSVDYFNAEGMKIVSDFMLGGKDFVYEWDEAWDAVLPAELNEDCTVHIVSVGEKTLPMLWEAEYGEGRFVVCNHSLEGKSVRGLLAASYSLLEEVCSYPVINGQAFFIDDFPSPVPYGESAFVLNDYGRDIAGFYSNVWWPDMLAMAEKYGFKFTGMVIESYDDNVTAPFETNRDIERFRYFGGMLLLNGGELGIHGYNHQPYCMTNFDYKGLYDEYNLWQTYGDMEASMDELLRFVSEIFPNQQLVSYVPPSNLLSREGRLLLANRYPQIKIIASLYTISDVEFEQEFDVSDDGIVNVPRITSGSIIGNYMRWLAISELNMHYVNTHFCHPDDVLDEFRGAEIGWEKMKDTMYEYFDHLYSSAPNLRTMTASGLAAAISRYDCAVITNREYTGDTYTFTLDGRYDSSYVMLRISGDCGEVSDISGGSIEAFGNGMYCVCADEDTVTVTFDKGELPS